MSNTEVGRISVETPALARVPEVIITTRKQKARSYQIPRMNRCLIRVPLDTTIHNTALSFACLNVCSLKNKGTGIYDFLFESSTDIFAITESWLSTEEEENLSCYATMLPEGYKIRHIPRSTGIRGAGVAVIYKDNLKLKIKKSSNSPDSNISTFEFMDCSISSISNRTIQFIVVYRPSPSKSNKLKTKDFWDEWSMFLSSLSWNHRDCIITGDINFHLEDKKKRHTARFLKTLDEFGLVQLVSEPTHAAGHLLDVLITTKEGHSIIMSSVTVYDANISNNHGHTALNRHYMIKWYSTLSKPAAPRKTVTYRDFKDFDADAFSSELRDLKLLEKCSGDMSTNDIMNRVNTEVGNLLGAHAPMKSRSIIHRPESPWYDDQLREQKRQKRRCERKFSKTCLEADHLLYRQQCNKFNKLLCTKRYLYQKAQADECSSNNKKFFSFASRLLGSDKKCISHGFENDKVAADAFASFFNEKIQIIGKELDEARNTLSTIDTNESGSMLHLVSQSRATPKLANLKPTNVDEVLRIISNSNNKYCILDILPTWLLKKNSDTLAPVLVTLFNKSMSSGIVPDYFKKAIIKPVLKKFDSDQDDLNQFRPVSNLPFLSKVMEKIVSSRIEQHLSTNKLLAKSQSAYRKHYSTETLVLKLSNDILSALDNKRGVLLVTLDISAAFDTVNHHMLLERYMSYFGIEGEVLAWMTSYLMGRQQTVSVGNHQSGSYSVDCGFPQGSVLGGMQYNMFASPMSEITFVHETEELCYADDTNAYKTFSIDVDGELNATIANIENCLKDVHSWMVNNRLKLNMDKTEVMVFVPKNKVKKLPLESCILNIGGYKIKVQEEIKILGVMFDRTMTMNACVNKMSSAAWLQYRRISKVRSTLTKDMTESLVNALVTPKIDYCNSVLCMLPVKSITKLQRVQNACAKLIFRAKKFNHVTPLMKQLHWLPVRYRTKFKVLLITYKSLNNLAPEYLGELLHSWNLRSSDMLLRPSLDPRSRYGKRTFACAAAALWNLLPTSIRCAESVDIFKKALKTHFFNEHYTT